MPRLNWKKSDDEEYRYRSRKPANVMAPTSEDPSCPPSISPRAFLIALDIIQKCEAMLMKFAFKRCSSLDQGGRKLVESMFIIDHHLATARDKGQITYEEHQLLSQWVENITDAAFSIGCDQHPYKMTVDYKEFENWPNREARGTTKPFTGLPPPSECKE